MGLLIYLTCDHDGCEAMVPAPHDDWSGYYSVRVGGWGCDDSGWIPDGWATVETGRYDVAVLCPDHRATA